jgi:ADP-dependent NAD(P)H-hydrate dehydratase / NAD(P)H-hydrate epimerase
MKILTAAEMREVDHLSTERFGIPSPTLMENAGASVAQLIAERFSNFASRRIAVLCGKGNNGGDGFVVARHLREMGAKPEVFFFTDTSQPEADAAANLKCWRDASGTLHTVVTEDQWQAAKPAIWSADIFVDALLGTGVRGRVEGLLEKAIQEVNLHSPGKSVIAVDIPSGLPADTGDAQGTAIVADFTVTFTAPKLGMILGRAGDYVGQLVVREIGSPPELIEEIGKGNVRWSEPREFAQFALPRTPSGHKGDYGHALVVAGSVGKSGAAVLAGWAALRAGVGLATVATPEPVLPIVASHTPEIMTEPLAATESGTISLRALEYNRFNALLKGKRALAIGPGLTTQTETQQFVRTIVSNRGDVPIILDADGLNAFDGHAANLKGLPGTLAITPHPGEMARLLGYSTREVQAQRLELGKKAAADWNAIVILKGHQTVVAAPDGEAWINSTGNPGMGTGGTGDVLTGILAGLTAQYGTSDWWRVLGFGVFLHGLAGDIAYADSGEAPLMASDLIHALPRAFQEFYSECGRG